MEPLVHFGTAPMPHFSIKDVPESWAEELRQRAARNHRSLQGELMAILEHSLGHARDTASSPGDAAGTRIVGFDKRGWPIVRQGTKTPEQVFDEMRKKGLKPVPGQPLAVDILRRDRDSR
jgi:plasmid stability protein